MRVALLPSVPTGPYAVHARCGWDAARTIHFLCTESTATVAALCGGAMCKLRSGEWRLVARPGPGSCLADVMAASPPYTTRRRRPWWYPVILTTLLLLLLLIRYLARR